MEADITSQAVGLGGSVDFSLMSLFLRADIVVKSVIIILIAASIYSWAIIIEKFKMFKKINQNTIEFEEKFWKSKSAESFYNNLPVSKDDPMSNVFRKTMQVVLKSKSRNKFKVASKWEKDVAGAGSVRSSAGTYIACTDVIDPLSVDVILS